MATIVIAPEGYLHLKRGVSYYMLRNCPIRRRLVLVAFDEFSAGSGMERRRFAELMVMTRQDFETGLVPQKQGTVPRLEVKTAGNALPPWLDDVKDVQFDAVDHYQLPKREGRPSPRDEVEARLHQIQPALDKIGIILGADDPDLELNRLARQSTPRINETRFRVWFYSYVAFDHNIWALLPPRTQWGKWDRMDPKYEDSKLGRPSIHLGAQFGFRTTPAMVDGILEGFRRYATSCDNLTEVWAKTIRKVFGGKTRKLPNGDVEAYHPAGGPLPSYDKFRYYTEKHIGREEIRVVLLGAHRYRQEEAPVMGSLMDDVANVGERAHLDSCDIKERPKGYLGDYALPPAKKVDMVDAASGQITGIGFSIGGENNAAYRMALFCAAIPKSVFGRLINTPIDDADWPGHGLPMEIFTDRGPGASDPVRESVSEWLLGTQLAPSWSPMSNSAVESKHARKKRSAGPPTTKLSKLTVIELIKREVQRVIMKNRSDDVSRRVSDRGVVEGKVTSPNELHSFLMSRHRTSLIQVSFDQAVRKFLEPVEFITKKGRIYLRQREYGSPILITSGLAKAILRADSMVLSGYVMPLVPFFAWIEHKGQLVEVQARADGADDAAWASLDELDRIAAARSRASGERQAKKPVETLHAQEQFFEDTGKEWHAGRVKTGRVNDRTSQALDEVRRLNETS